MSYKVFVSHRSTDKVIAEMFLDFLVALGFPRDEYFCSSLPGNDIKEKIPDEVKQAIDESVVNIVVLSKEYYESAYCLNEAGVIWYKNALTIPIALPEIKSKDMIGFLDSDYKIRRLDSSDDVAYIYDSICDICGIKKANTSYFVSELEKLSTKYKNYLDNGTAPTTRSVEKGFDFSTDDERIIVYYIFTNHVRKVSKYEIIKWLIQNEIKNVNINNAFDLLSCIKGSKLIDDVLEFDYGIFRECISYDEDKVKTLKESFDKHQILSAEKFKNMWNEGVFDDVLKLFISYIVDERISDFGDRWMTQSQEVNIKAWEEKHSLDSVLSNNYSKCLSLFIYNDFVYESDWTSHGNPRQYSLYDSLENLLFNCPSVYFDELSRIKQEHTFDLPF